MNVIRYIINSGFDNVGPGPSAFTNVRPINGVNSRPQVSSFNGAANGRPRQQNTSGNGPSFGNTRQNGAKTQGIGNRRPANNAPPSGTGATITFGTSRPSEGNVPSGLGSQDSRRPSGFGAQDGIRPSGFGTQGSRRPSGFGIQGSNRPSGFDAQGGNRQSGFGNQGSNRPNGFGTQEGNRPNGFGNNRQSGLRRPNNGPSGLGDGSGRPSGSGVGSPGGRPFGLGVTGSNRPGSGSPSGRPGFGAGRPSGSTFNSPTRPASSRPNNGFNRPSGFGSDSSVPGGFSSGARPFRPSGALGSSGNDEPRRGKELGVGVTSVTRPVQNRPAVLGKLAGAGNGDVNNWDSGTWEKFGPGGFRSFNETLGPEVCQRPGLFRHPQDCTKFYECYWDKWIEKFTLHIFPCPVAMAVRQYDESISACNWPFLGPNCEGGNYY